MGENLSDAMHEELSSIVETFPARGLNVTNGKTDKVEQGFAPVRNCDVCGKRFMLPCTIDQYAYAFKLATAKQQREHRRAYLACSYTCFRLMQQRKKEEHEDVMRQLREKRRRERDALRDNDDA